MQSARLIDPTNAKSWYHRHDLSTRQKRFEEVLAATLKTPRQTNACAESDKRPAIQHAQQDFSEF